ncbi:hypothetical protein KC352_g45158, partial [Hortaea werneckii]
QVLLNIVGNAIKFTETGEVFVRCSVVLENQDMLAKNEMFIKFEIIDTGRGFTEKEADYLFKRFSQIDGSSTRQHGGTGLGNRGFPGWSKTISQATRRAYAVSSPVARCWIFGELGSFSRFCRED